MFHSAPARPGKQVAQGVDSIGLLVARVTWKISLASSGSEIWCAAAASWPAEDTSAASPAVVGFAVGVGPVSGGALGCAWGRSEVWVEWGRLVVAGGPCGVVLLF